MLIKRMFVICCVLFVAAGYADDQKNEDVNIAWNRFNNAGNYAEASAIARDLLKTNFEHRYTLPMLAAIIEDGFYQKGKREETFAFLEELCKKVSNSNLGEAIEIQLLELYAKNNSPMQFSTLFRKLVNDQEDRETLYNLIRIAAENNCSAELAIACSALQPIWTKTEAGEGWYDCFSGWLIALNGDHQKAISQFELADSKIPRDGYGFSTCSQLDLFWGRTLLRMGKVEKGIEKIARSAFWTGNQRYLEELQTVLNDSGTLRGGDISLRTAVLPRVKKLRGETYGGDSWELNCSQKPLTILLFWSSTCLPCHIQLKNQVHTYNRYKDSGLDYVAFSLQPNPGKDTRFFTDHSLPYTSVTIDKEESLQEVMQTRGLKIFPTTVILDRSGQILARFVNFRIGDQVLIEKLVQKLM